MGTAYSHAARHDPHETLPLKSARRRYVMSRGRLVRSPGPLGAEIADEACRRFIVDWNSRQRKDQRAAAAVMEDPDLLKRRLYTAVSRATQRVTLLARGPLPPFGKKRRPRNRNGPVADDRKAQLSFAFCQIHYLNWYFTIYRSRKSTWGVDARAPKRTRDTMTLNPRLRMLQPCPLQRQQPVRLSFARNHADDERIARGGNAQSFLPVLPV